MLKLAKGDQIGPYPYRIIRQLGKGEGGMSIVYLASIGQVHQPKANQLIALKIANVGTGYDEFYRKTLDNEVEHLRKLKHPGIVRLHKIQTPTPYAIYSARTYLPGKPWFSVMQYLAGGSLADLLKRQKKLDVGLVLRIVHQLAKTIEYIHHRGYVHLDIKPQNIVFRESLSRQVIAPVLIDFGISRSIGQGGLEAGTRIWSSPERLESQKLPPEMMAKPHPLMDIYALGLLLYRMLAGRLPFQGSRKRITDAILKGNPTAPSTYNSSLNPELDQLVLSAMAKKPTDRPTAVAFAQTLENLISHPDYSDYDVPSDEGKNSGFLNSMFKFFSRKG